MTKTATQITQKNQTRTINKNVNYWHPATKKIIRGMDILKAYNKKESALTEGDYLGKLIEITPPEAFKAAFLPVNLEGTYYNIITRKTITGQDLQDRIDPNSPRVVQFRSYWIEANKFDVKGGK